MLGPAQTPKSKKRMSFGGFLSPQQSPRQSPKMTNEERKRSFEEWLKIASDNKINGQNTWNLALIDYFADMSLLREGDSINFQKASYTLDGCVKVYSSRIDSVDSETKKLLMGLADKEEVEESGSTENTNQTKRRKQLAKTLSDNQALSMEALELDFAADPLFQKTAADFDEGGAKGLLLSHLDISRDGRIIFDASDFSTDVQVPTGEFECDIAGLKSKFGSKLGNLHSQFVCPTFSKFQFNSDQFNEDFQLENRDDFYYEPMEFSDHEDDGGPMNYDDFPVYHGEENPFDATQPPMIPTEQTREEVELMDQNIMKIVQGGLVKSENNMFSYFDNLTGSSWAGPEYWKSRSLRKPVTAEKKTPTKKKEKQSIDFLNAEPIDPKVLFAKSKTSTLLPKSKLSETFLLPEDHQYRSDKFTRLFLRPEFTFQEFTEKVESLKRSTTTMMVPSNRESNQFQFDAPAEMNGISYLLDGPEFDNEPIYGGFEEDDDDEIEYPTTLELPTEHRKVETDAANLSYGDQLVAEPFRLKSKPLMFARTAKRIDVQKLKENLWSKLADDHDTPKELEHVEKKFTDLVHDIDDCYPEKQRKDISVAFCFICVLHLANENNLQILGDQSMKDLVIKS